MSVFSFEHLEHQRRPWFGPRRPMRPIGEPTPHDIAGRRERPGTCHQNSDCLPSTAAGNAWRGSRGSSAGSSETAARARHAPRPPHPLCRTHPDERRIELVGDALIAAHGPSAYLMPSPKGPRRSSRRLLGMPEPAFLGTPLASVPPLISNAPGGHVQLVMLRISRQSASPIAPRSHCIRRTDVHHSVFALRQQ